MDVAAPGTLMLCRRGLIQALVVEHASAVTAYHGVPNSRVQASLLFILRAQSSNTNDGSGEAGQSTI